MTFDELIAKYGMNKIDSLTKYPSILTYHQLGNKGGLKNELIEEGFTNNTQLSITEKIDGTNGRLLYYNGDYFIGSRDSLVHAKGDRVITSDLVDPIEKSLHDFFEHIKSQDKLIVIFGEVYGYRIQNGAKQYCTENCKEKGYRIFDVWMMDQDELCNMLEQDIAKIVYWRDHNQQPWLDVNTLVYKFANMFNIDTVPENAVINSDDLPIDAIETYKWLQNYSSSHAIIGDGTDTNNPKFGRAEGVVIRTSDRKIIRKLRFEDYARGERNGWK